jgi:hypothetical protein
MEARRVARPRARRPPEYVEVSVYLAEASELPGKQFYLPMTKDIDPKYAVTARMTTAQKARLDALAQSLIDRVDPREREIQQAYSDYASQTSWVRKLLEDG